MKVSSNKPKPPVKARKTKSKPGGGTKRAGSSSAQRKGNGGLDRSGNAAHLYSEIRHSPDEIRDLFRRGEYPYKNKIKTAVYEAHKEELQVELLKVQNWVKQTGQRIVTLFEGRDAAGRVARSSASWSI